MGEHADGAADIQGGRVVGRGRALSVAAYLARSYGHVANFHGSDSVAYMPLK